MNNKNKLWIVFSLLIVFAAGVTAGILFDKHVYSKKTRRPARKTSGVHFPTLEIMADELKLTEDQQNQIRELFKHNEEEFKNLSRHMRKSLSEMRKQLITDIKSALTEDQTTKFEAMLEKYLSQRKRTSYERKRRPNNPERDKGEIK